MSYLSRLDKYRVIILDDIGYVRKTDSETQVLFEFIAHRYESGSLIITSNQPFSEWGCHLPGQCDDRGGDRPTHSSCHHHQTGRR